MSSSSFFRRTARRLSPERRDQLKDLMARNKVARQLSQGPSATAARALIAAGHEDGAERLVTSALGRRPDNPYLHRVAADLDARQGSISSAHDHAQRAAATGGGPSGWNHARKIAGRVRETDASWRPGVDRGTAPEATGGVLYLAKESRPFHNNGFCTRTHESLLNLRRHGVDVFAVTMPGFPGNVGIDDAPPVSIVEDVEYRHLLPHAGTLTRTLALDEYLSLSTQVLAAEVARSRPRLLHIGSGHRGYETALVGDAVARWAGIPWLYEVRSFFETTWTADARYRESAEYFHRRLRTETRMMHAADAVVTISGPMRDEIVTTHGVDPSKVFVVPNAVDATRFQPVEPDAALRSRLGLGDAFVLGYVSNISHPREGQEVLVAATARMRKAGRNVKTLLVGGGKRLAEMKKLAASLGVADHVVFTGELSFDEVSAYYGLIDLFVVPRIDERAGRLVSPMKPFEAMAMRIPVLVSDLPALVEIAGEGTRAATFHAGDADDLARVAGALADDPAARARLVDAAEVWVREERTWSKVCEGFLDVYRTLVPALTQDVAT